MTAPIGRPISISPTITMKPVTPTATMLMKRYRSAAHPP
jgi:hypothetical protein